MQHATRLAESGIVPDPVIRFGIRRLLENRRKQIQSAAGAGGNDDFVDMMDRSPIALLPDLANQQHYEVPPEFFEIVLGKRCKYSCCYWPANVRSLDEAEEAALDMTCVRSRLEDGMSVLDLGCGWGSLSLWIAEKYPACAVTAVSNSRSQRSSIEQRAISKGLGNLRVITADMNHFASDRKYDRIVSVEMFEHMRNYRALFARLASWLERDGYFFMHVFCHHARAYEYVDAGPGDWMSRHFFSGGMMPSRDLPLRFQDHLTLKDQWDWTGHHYRKTADAWLANMDANRSSILPILEEVYGRQQAQQWWMRWRMFFLAVSEMFGSHGGREWLVAHYLFQPVPAVRYRQPGR